MASNGIVIQPGKNPPELLKAGEIRRLKASPGQNLAIVLSAQAPEATGAFVARKSGTSLELLFANDSRLVIDEFFGGIAKNTVSLPANPKTGKSRIISSADTGYALGGDVYLLHASGSGPEIEALLAHGSVVAPAAIDTGLIDPTSLPEDPMASVTRNRPETSDAEDTGFLSMGVLPLSLIGLGAVAAATATSSGDSGAAKTVVKGQIQLGAMLPGNGLTLVLLNAAGEEIGRVKVRSDGSFSTTIDVGYEGILRAVVEDASTNPDYQDLATSVAKDLNAELSAFTVVAADAREVILNINALTTVAAEEIAALTAPTVEDVERINDLVAAVFGLDDVDLVGSEVTTVDDPDFDLSDGGSAEERYGAILAALSGVDELNEGDTQATVDDLVERIDSSADAGSDDGLPEDIQALLVEGADELPLENAEDLVDEVTELVDRVPPVIPLLSLTLDTGISGTDRITRNGALTVAPVENRATVQYSLDATTWSNSFTPVEGVNTVYARQVDTAGNASGASIALTFTLDTTASAPIVSLLNDTGVDNTDFITAVGTLSVSGRETGSRVEYSTDGTTWSSAFTAEEGSNTVYVRQIDTAGNVSAASEPFVFILDTVPPTAPEVGLANDTGPSDSDRITNDGTLEVTGVDPGATLEYSTDGIVWSDTFTPQEGSNTVYVRQTDVLGDTSPASAVLTFTLDAAIALSDIATGAGGFVINGLVPGDDTGLSVASVGDINGDGLDDLVVGVAAADPAAGNDAGRTYVVFGKTGTAALNLSAVTTGVGGFVIEGEFAGDQSGTAVAAAGDINGDGLADLVIGAPGSAVTGPDAGRVYVVFGKTDTNPVELADISNGIGGFAINAETAGDQLGLSVAGTGDVNGDGLADLVIGAPLADTVAGVDAGKSYVVFGQLTANVVQLADVAAGVGGFVIEGQAAGDGSGASVAGAGDVNGDGLADVLIGAPEADSVSGVDSGRTYVVFGRASGTPVQLSVLAQGNGGFVINGQAPADNSGMSIASAGDVNGDGLADIVIGAAVSDPATGNDAGRSYVVFGRTAVAPIELSALSLATGGFVINGEGVFDNSGMSVANAGDINGDGLSDLVIGAPGVDVSAVSDTGRAYVVFGQQQNSNIDLRSVAVGVGGFVINGEQGDDLGGSTVSAGGDINGDGLADLLVGAPGAAAGIGLDAGRVYVIFGASTGVFAQVALDLSGSAGADDIRGTSASETIAAGAGNDTVIAEGGADVIDGGSGDDVIIVDATNVAALSGTFGTGDNLLQWASIDGGTGIDTLQLEGAGILLDLTLIANQGAGLPGSQSRLESIEVIQLQGNGDNSLQLSLSDVLDLTGFNIASNFSGWTDGSYDLGAEGAGLEQRHQLVIMGNSGDSVQSSGWTSVGTVTFAGDLYHVYNAAAAQLIIQDGVTANVI